MIEPLLQAERAMTVGMLDQAERLYAGVFAADPRNSIAVVGLARVALERGDDRGALVLGRRALAIDPENVAARRLVARLEEVMTTRGEALPPPETGPGTAGAEAPADAETSSTADAGGPVAAGWPDGGVPPAPAVAPDAALPTVAPAAGPVAAEARRGEAQPRVEPARPPRPSLLHRLLRRH